jgi:FkbM family methyltransferase
MRDYWAGHRRRVGVQSRCAIVVTMSCIGDLVYDVGMHNGDDTAYYLWKGLRVVAIEANPALIAPAERRFAAEIAAGRLRLVHAGIAATRGEADLHVSADHDLLGSFDRGSAARFGGEVATVRVRCVPFADVLAEHGVPHYLKIDIEGSDRLCLDALAPPDLPAYVSIEMSHESGDRDIRRLQALGYRDFKCVRQYDFRVIGPHDLGHQLALRRRRARAGLASFGPRVRRRLARTLYPARDGAWRFSRHSSGSFGSTLAGEWVDAAAMLGVWQALHDIDRELAQSGLGEWFDIHAALAGRPS